VIVRALTVRAKLLTRAVSGRFSRDGADAHERCRPNGLVVFLGPPPNRQPRAERRALHKFRGRFWDVALG